MTTTLGDVLAATTRFNSSGLSRIEIARPAMSVKNARGIHLLVHMHVEIGF